MHHALSLASSTLRATAGAAEIPPKSRTADVVEMIRGAPGTYVKIEFSRPPPTATSDGTEAEAAHPALVPSSLPVASPGSLLPTTAGTTPPPDSSLSSPQQQQQNQKKKKQQQQQQQQQPPPPPQGTAAAAAIPDSAAGVSSARVRSRPP